MLIITTDGDNDNNLEELIKFHDIQSDNIININCQSQLPMLNNNNKLNESIYDWIESAA